jgi:EmrB/QacA subfamily drug resistance transporter
MSARLGRPALPRPGVVALLALAELMLTLDLSIVNVALPAIRGELGFSQSSLEWVVNGYALTFGGFLLLGGRAADLFGGRRVFLGALGAFTLASLACGLAPGQPVLVAARAVQGLSAGVLSPATLSILTATYTRPAERNRALSVWTAVAIGGGAVGALLGGALTELLSWRWIFFVNLPVGLGLLAFGAARLPRAAGTARRGLDLAGAVTVTAGLTALVWALIRSGERGWAAGEVLAGLVAAALLLGAFVVLETRVAREPLVPFSVFRSPLVRAGNLLSFLSFLPVVATWFFLTLCLQGVRGFTPAEAGLLFLPMSLAVVVGSQVSFRAVARSDARLLFAAGGLLAAAGLAWLARLSPATGLPWVLGPASVAMAGGGLMFAPITLAAVAGVPADQGGLASGLLNTSRQIGGALGLAILATVAGAAGTPTGGFGGAFLAGAGIFVATALAGVLVLPGQLGAPRRQAPAPVSTSTTTPR